MAIISREHGYLFICAPGTGCTAVADTLIHHYGGQWIPSESIRDADGQTLVDSKHTTIQQILDHKILTAEELDSLFKFVTVRNPFDFMPSEWLRLRKWAKNLDDPDSWLHHDQNAVWRVRAAVDNDFRGFMKAAYTAERGNPRFFQAQYLEGADKIIRHERLQEDLDRVLDGLGIRKDVQIESVNITTARKQDYRSYYDRDTVSLVYDLFLPTFHKFGYSFEPKVASTGEEAEKDGGGRLTSKNLLGNGAFRHWANEKPESWTPARGKTRLADESRNGFPVVELPPDPSGEGPTQIMQPCGLEASFTAAKAVATIEARVAESGKLAFTLYVEIDGEETFCMATHSGDGEWKTLCCEIDLPAGAKIGKGRVLVQLRAGSATPGYIAQASVVVTA